VPSAGPITLNDGHNQSIFLRHGANELLQACLPLVAGGRHGDGGAFFFPRGCGGRLSADPGDSLGVVDLSETLRPPRFTGTCARKPVISQQQPGSTILGRDCWTSKSYRRRRPGELGRIGSLSRRLPAQANRPRDSSSSGRLHSPESRFAILFGLPWRSWLSGGLARPGEERLPSASYSFLGIHHPRPACSGRSPPWAAPSTNYQRRADGLQATGCSDLASANPKGDFPKRLIRTLWPLHEGSKRGSLEFFPPRFRFRAKRAGRGKRID